MDKGTANKEEELEINLPAPKPKTMPKEREKQKPVTKLLYGGIPADPEDLGLQIYVYDPSKYTNYDIIMIGKKVKAGNVKFSLHKL